MRLAKKKRKRGKSQIEQTNTGGGKAKKGGGVERRRWRKKLACIYPCEHYNQSPTHPNFHIKNILSCQRPSHFSRHPWKKTKF